MRSRHRLSKFLLRRGLRFPGRQWTQPHERCLCKLRFDDAPSQAVLIDYVCAVDALVQRRRARVSGSRSRAAGGRAVRAYVAGW
jgi:hypothetical protein